MSNSITERAAAPPIWFLALCTASAVIGLTLLSPALPLIKTELNVSSDAVQQLLSVYMIAIACGGIAGAIIVALGGAQEFSIASGTLIVMSAIAVTSMVFVFRRSNT